MNLMLMFRRRRSGSSFTSCTIVHKGLDAETGEDFDIAFDRIIPNLVTSKTFCLLDLTYISYHLFRLSDLNRGRSASLPPSLRTRCNKTLFPSARIVPSKSAFSWLLRRYSARSLAEWLGPIHG